MGTEKSLKSPEIEVFAGPNGSGKSTITRLGHIVGTYVNADDIKRALNCTDLEAAQEATRQREMLLSKGADFTFETVLSTPRNLELLKKAKDAGYFIRCIYILTNSPEINVSRVKSRFQNGGHDVPEDKIISRYYRALTLIPELINICDIIHIYDNSDLPFRIFKKRKTMYYYWENTYWTCQRIEELTQINLL